MHDDECEDPDTGFELVMPFKVVKSAGGPYDDESFVAGYRLGQLDNVLADRSLEEHVLSIEPDAVPQADLIAMRHGYSCTVTEYDVQWSTARFIRQAETAGVV